MRAKKYRYETRAVFIDYECEKDLNTMAEEGWRFVSFVPKSSWETGGDCSENRKLAKAVFEREIKEPRHFGPG